MPRTLLMVVGCSNVPARKPDVILLVADWTDFKPSRPAPKLCKTDFSLHRTEHGDF